MLYFSGFVPALYSGEHLPFCSALGRVKWACFVYLLLSPLLSQY